MVDHDVDAGNSEDDGGTLTDHKVSYNVQVMFNTIVNGRGISVGSGKSIQPRNIVVAYNLLQGAGPLITATGGTGMRAVGNIVNGGAAGIGSGVQSLDPQAGQDGRHLPHRRRQPGHRRRRHRHVPLPHRRHRRPPADARPTSAPEELSTAPAKYGLLTEKDVGPDAP